MTVQQLDAVKALAERFGSRLLFTDVLHNPYGLPEGWVSVIVRTPWPIGEDGTYHRDTPIKIVAGVSPAGEVNS
jgi:hypothetical protein